MTSDSTRIALFPGQGAQHVGMAKDLFENFRVVRETFEEASDAVHRDLKKICFDGPDSDLNLTENTQPCLLTASVAAFRVAESEHGFKPAAVAGHSLGEYSALVAARALKLSTAAAWVAKRGAAMQQAVPAGQGGMAAVMGLTDEQVESLCAEATRIAKQKRERGEAPHVHVSIETIAEPANFNAPGQIVIAGSADAMATAASLPHTDNRFSRAKVIPLTVSGPFHSRLMGPARAAMAEIFATTDKAHLPSNLICPYVPNRTGRITSEPGLVLEFLVEQIDRPVLWKQSVEALLQAGFRDALEFGPGRVLQGLSKRIATTDGAKLTVKTVGDAESVKAMGATT